MFSSKGQDKLLGCFFLGEEAPALFLAAFRKSTELSGAGYARVPLKGKLTVSGGAISNTDDIVFPVARDDWGEIVSLAIVNTAGEVLYKDDLKSSQVIVIGQKLRVPSGKLHIRFVNEK